MFFPSATFAAEHPCQSAAQHLRGDLNSMANGEGLWTLMEQKGLKDTSVIGMQADGKLSRLVGQFEELCEGGKKPTKQLFKLIQNLIGNARVIFNPRSSGEEIIKLITKLSNDMDAVLAKIK